MAEMLKLDNIHKTFNPGTINEKIALNGVNLTLNEGDFVTVIGGNGAGKSTTLNAIAGVWPIDSGKIYIGGDDVTKLSEHKRAKYLGRVFQDPMTGTATTMSSEENMAIAARRGEKRGLSWGITHQERDTYREMLKALDLGLEDRLTSKVGLLSGGQRQALTLLMATLVTPLRISVRSRMERARAGPSLRPGQATIWQFMWMPASARRRMMAMDFPAFRLPISSTRSSGSVV